MKKMSIKKSQLKDKQLVGDSIVEENVNPKSVSEAIIDSSSGNTMDVTLDNLWNAINNRLSRIVNSVNGRTGVVVLTPDDVGLGKVSNVSYGEIERMVIDEIDKAFKDHQIVLVDSMDDLAAMIADNDRIYADRPFYAKRGYSPDKLAYIGYIEWVNNALNISHCKAINVIGEADDSILYNESKSGVDYTGGKLGVNIWSGQDILKVREKGTDSDKSDAGLYLDETKIASKVKVYDGVYGYQHSGSTVYGGSGDPLLYTLDTIPSGNYYKLNILYNDGNGTTITNLPLFDTSLKLNDQILIIFVDYTHTSKFDSNLLGRPSIFGKVTQVPDEGDYSTPFIINAAEFRDPINWSTNPVKLKSGLNGSPYMSNLVRVRSGLNYMFAESLQSPEEDWNEIRIHDTRGCEHDTQPFLRYLSYTGAGPRIGISNINNSGLNVMAGNSGHDPIIPSATGSSETITLDVDKNYPWESDIVWEGTYRPDKINSTINGPAGPMITTGGGLQIFPDSSMCVNNMSWYGKDSWKSYDASTKPWNHADYVHSGTKPASAYAANYHTITPVDYDTSADLMGHGFSENISVLGINLDKMVIQENFDDPCPPHFLNISGLRITPPNSVNSCIWYGITNAEEYADQLPHIPASWKQRSVYNWISGSAYQGFSRESEQSRNSGGLSVNVGDYLEIGIPKNEIPDEDHYFDSGKVNVRIGDGLCGEPIVWQDPTDHSKGMVEGNRIQVAFDPDTSGLKFVSTDPDSFFRTLAINLKTDGGLAIDENGQLYATGGGGGGSANVPKLVIKDVYDNEFVYNSEGTSTVTLMLGDGLKLEEDN